MSAAPGTAASLSFVVIAYNEEHNIAACLRSILAQHGAEGAEIVVVDDGSVDATGAIVRSLAEDDDRVTLLSQANGGRGAARAAGVGATHGDLVAMVDADIVLPRRWLRTCLTALEGFDAVGGVAVPDGDAAYVWRRFSLTAKPKAPTMAVTGNNGLYRRAVLDLVGFNSDLREGEDTDLNLRMASVGLRPLLLTDLHVEHLEDKSFATSVGWLFECGSGATRHLLWYRKVRVPDLAFFGFLVMVVQATIPGRQRRARVAALGAFVPAASTAHLAGRFELPLGRHLRGRTLGAVAVNTVLVASYFAGRTYGLLKWGTQARPDSDPQ